MVFKRANLVTSFLLISISFALSLCATWRFIPSFQTIHIEYGVGLDTLYYQQYFYGR